ncbi:MAG: hypothetical protein WCJ57_00055 [Candidatus Falkowbacteria bacterium]
MEETKKHEHACCGGHGKEMAGCSCMNKPWMRILILFCAALVIFFMGVCVASRNNDRFEGGRSYGQEKDGGCRMLNTDSTTDNNSSTCGQEKNGCPMANTNTTSSAGCPMRQAE